MRGHASRGSSLRYRSGGAGDPHDETETVTRRATIPHRPFADVRPRRTIAPDDVPARPILGRVTHPESLAQETIHWRRTAAPAPAPVPLEGELDVDALIVGAGLTGLRAAVSLAEAGVRTAVLDAHDVGHGASGRSGGQCNPIWRATPAALAARLGDAPAERLVRATLTAADDLFDDVRRLGIDCGAEQNGWIQAAHTPGAARELRALGDAWRAAGADIGTLAGPELHAASGSGDYEFALSHAKGGCVQPLALTRGFAAAARALGARIHENTPALAMERAGDRWSVRTPAGRVTADKVILTTNAYTDGLWPDLRRTVLPMVSVVLATAPVGDELRASVLPGRRTLSDTRLAIFYARYDATDRLVFGCVGSADAVDAWGGRRRLANGLRTVFPQLAEVPVECVWSGRIAVTPTMMPHLAEPAPGVLAGLGFSGRGIAMTSVMGRTLARRALGADEAELAFPVSTLSPMRFHGLSRALVPAMAPAMSLRDRAAVRIGRIARR